jgi:hypothetical protein
LRSGGGNLGGLMAHAAPVIGASTAMFASRLQKRECEHEARCRGAESSESLRRFVKRWQNYLCVAAVELPVTVSEMVPEEAAKEELPA